MKKILSAIVPALFYTLQLFAQETNDVPKGWHLMDKEKDGYYGISLNKAYDFIRSKNLKSTPVIVAVIDSGIDTVHEDLKDILWNNPGEIPGNGIDDDKNGYVDDVYGWNFLGGRDGRNIKDNSSEAVRIYYAYKDKFENVEDSSSLTGKDKELFQMWERAKEDVGTVNPQEMYQLMLIRRVYNDALAGDSILKSRLGVNDYTGSDIKDFKPENATDKRARESVLRLYFGLDIELDKSAKELYTELGEELDREERKNEARQKAPKNYRAEIVQDNYDDINDRFYGNGDVMANTPMHGSHVSGVIAAVRNNGKGIDGIADNVKIMQLRAVPNGDEYDKDVALAIRYAVDNGAQIINMSFGKSFSPEKQWVDDAVKYAESRDVLLVAAAGNDKKLVDYLPQYPNPYLLEGRKVTNWITVGASSDPASGDLVAGFSNYGKKNVDVFAPGVKIYSTAPGGNTYSSVNGTSFASPIVAGLSALILEYFPTLSARQIKYAIEKSAVKPDIKVKKPGTEEMVDLSDISVTGGLVNAYEAVKIAATLKGDRAVQKAKEKSSIKQNKKS